MDTLEVVTRRLEEAEALGQVGTWELDQATGELYTSDENRRLFFGPESRKGFEAADYFDAVHPEDRDWVSKRDGDLVEQGKGAAEIEYRVVWPDGSVHWILGHKRVVRDPQGRALRQIGTNADVTRQKSAELELRGQRELLAKLSRRLIDAQEAERRALARELHDDLGQILTALRLNVIRQEGHAAETVALLDGAIERTRNLARDLRPAVLDDLGLAAALRGYVPREAERAGLECQLELTEEGRMPALVETTCFRLVQEATTNVVRHAGATRIEVTLRPERTRLLLVVRDDGVGFDVPAARRRAANGECMGIVSMQERVALAGGSLDIESAPGGGTTIRAAFPIEPGGPL